ncbi:MAG: heat-inducible transcriptional repressor HrcA [Lachnospiraceae bacterium]|nr:heat-inducible transcriptional repressor HrcA [Lachnospiraceae bacterium]
MELELDERKLKILKAIIQNYLETGEPVGSRTISKYADLALSSATIRNEMSDLEEMGLIMQPHTSAGRIPTDKGYRLYVDELMEEKEREKPDGNEMLIQRVDRVELLLKNLAKILANNTNYASLVTAPQYHHNKLKFIQLSKVDEKKILAVVMMEGNVVKNTLINTLEPVDEQIIVKMNLLLNSFLTGLSVSEMNLAVISKLKNEAGEYAPIIETVLDTISSMITEDDEEPQIYTSGATNIFKYPELSDGEKASGLISTFEEKSVLNELVVKSMNEPKQSHDINIYIGDENKNESMKDCSVVTANYELGDGMQGIIGIVGPKRMDYEKVVGTLRTLMAQLDDIYNKS